MKEKRIKMNFNNDMTVLLMQAFIIGTIGGVISALISHSLFLIYAKRRLENFIKTGKSVLLKQNQSGCSSLSSKSLENIIPLNDMLPLDVGKRTDILLSNKEEQELFNRQMSEAKRDSAIARLNGKNKKGF